MTFYFFNYWKYKRRSKLFLAPDISLGHFLRSGNWRNELQIIFMRWNFWKDSHKPYTFLSSDQNEFFLAFIFWLKVYVTCRIGARLIHNRKLKQGTEQSLHMNNISKLVVTIDGVGMEFLGMGIFHFRLDRKIPGASKSRG